MTYFRGKGELLNGLSNNFFPTRDLTAFPTLRKALQCSSKNLTRSNQFKDTDPVCCADGSAFRLSGFRVAAVQVLTKERPP